MIFKFFKKKTEKGPITKILDEKLDTLKQDEINNIPIYNTNRGGKLTWHGPGQRIIYFIINLKRRGLDIRRFVNNIEKFIIGSLSNLNIKAYKKKIL